MAQARPEYPPKRAEQLIRRASVPGPSRRVAAAQASCRACCGRAGAYRWRGTARCWVTEPERRSTEVQNTRRGNLVAASRWFARCPAAEQPIMRARRFLPAGKPVRSGQNEDVMVMLSNIRARIACGVLSLAGIGSQLVFQAVVEEQHA